jgi:hypothetical protein
MAQIRPRRQDAPGYMQVAVAVLQVPLTHWRSRVQMPPVARPTTHAMPLHQSPVAQSVSPTGPLPMHEVRHAVALVLQAYGVHETVVGFPVHAPMPLQLV